MERQLPVVQGHREAEQMEFPAVPDDHVWCTLRGKLVGATECATDACLDPNMRPVCWEGHIARGFDWTPEER